MGTIKYNWQEIQSYYDLGHTLSETAEKFGIRQCNLSKSKYFTSRPVCEQRAMSVITRQKNNSYEMKQSTKDKLSKIATDRNFGGKNYRKTFDYNGVILESSYELTLAQDLDKNFIKWHRPKRFKWVDSLGKNRHYTPDFYLPDYDVYLDPKNDYLIKIDSEKIKMCSEQNNIRIVVLSKNYLDWASIKEICGIDILVVN